MAPGGHEAVSADVFGWPTRWGGVGELLNVPGMLLNTLQRTGWPLTSRNPVSPPSADSAEA